MENQEKKSTYKKVDYILGGLAAIGSMKLTRALVKASIETRNPIVGLCLLTFECAVGIETFAHTAISSKTARYIFGGVKEGVKKFAEDVVAEDDEEEKDNG